MAPSDGSMDMMVAGERASSGARKPRRYTGKPWLVDVETEDLQLTDLIDVTETDGGLIELYASDMRTV